MSTATPSDTTTRLRTRARRLRSQAASLHPLLADTYRRRATELDLQAWLEAVWNPPLHPLPTPPTGGPARRPRTGPGTNHLRLAVA